MAADIRAQIQPKFKKIIDVGWMGDASEADLAEADIAWGFLPMNLQSVSQVPRLRFVQAISAGTDFVLKSQMWREPGAKDFKLASSAGVHVGACISTLVFEGCLTDINRLHPTSMFLGSGLTELC